MFDTFRRSYAIFRQSLTVLAKDKELLIFPLLSGIFTIIAFAGMAFAGYITGFFGQLQHSRAIDRNLVGYAGLFLWYFVSWFIVIFFNVAIVHCAKMRLDGGDPTVGDGFRAASQHLGRIAAWALVSATVGVILRVIAERTKLIGKIVSSLLGAAWNVATFFIVPVMIFERRSLSDSVRKSSELIAKTWGESLVAAGGIGVFSMLLGAAGLIFPVAAFVTGSVPMILWALGVMVVYWLALAVVSSALSAIFRTSLYLYAAEGRTPEGFTPEYIEEAFAPKGLKRVARYA